MWWLGWVVVGAGLATAVLLPSRSGCSMANEFECSSAVPLIRLAVLAAAGVLAVILTFVGPGSR